MKTFRGHEFWTWDGNQHPVLSDEAGLVLEGPVFCVFQPKSNKYYTFQTNRVASRLFARWLWPWEWVCVCERESVWTSCHSNTHKGNQTTRVLTRLPANSDAAQDDEQSTDKVSLIRHHSIEPRFLLLKKKDHSGNILQKIIFLYSRRVSSPCPPLLLPPGWSSSSWACSGRMCGSQPGTWATATLRG